MEPLNLVPPRVGWLHRTRDGRQVVITRSGLFHMQETTDRFFGHVVGVGGIKPKETNWFSDGRYLSQNIFGYEHGADLVGYLREVSPSEITEPNCPLKEWL